jgi:hypothetical protein
MRADYTRARHFPGANLSEFEMIYLFVISGSRQYRDRLVPFGDQDLLTAFHTRE